MADNISLEDKLKEKLSAGEISKEEFDELFAKFGSRIAVIVFRLLSGLSCERPQGFNPFSSIRNYRV